MFYIPTIISLIEVVLVLVPALLAVAYVTVAERKTMASMQRRLGPNVVGYYGLLQAFADALKLLLKEYVAPTQANMILFFLGPIITLFFGYLGYAVIPLVIVLGLRYCGVKSSNSGETLKLILPSYSWKAISGWINHSGKVTICKIIERAIGNRGSKSVIGGLCCLNVTVKEQRVNDGWCIILQILKHLRCILKGFEINYLIKTLFKQFKNFSPSVQTQVCTWVEGRFIDEFSNLSCSI